VRDVSVGGEGPGENGEYDDVRVPADDDEAPLDEFEGRKERDEEREGEDYVGAGDGGPVAVDETNVIFPGSDEW